LSPALLHSLRTSRHFDYFLVGIDSNPNPDALGPSAKLVDAFHVVPQGSSVEYEDAICELVKAYSIEFILPGSDDEAFALAKCGARLAEFGATLLISSLDTLNTIADKARTYERLQADNVPVPDFCLVKTEEEFFRAIDKFGFPEATIVCKPSSGRGGRGVYVLEGNAPPPSWLGGGQRENRISATHLPQHQLLRDLAQGYLVMPRLYTPAYDADVFPTYDGSLKAVVRQRMNPAGIPFSGNIFAQSNETVEYCSAIANSLSLDGIHDVDLMTGRDGALRLLEVNPRPSGSMAVSLFAGVPIVDVAIGTFLGIDIDFQEPASGLVVSPDDLQKTIEDLF
jgi:carbamoylphosphate synthase large subunit